VLISILYKKNRFNKSGRGHKPEVKKLLNFNNFSLAKKAVIGYIDFLSVETNSAWVQILWINSGKINIKKAKKKE